MAWPASEAVAVTVIEDTSLGTDAAYDVVTRWNAGSNVPSLRLSPLRSALPGML